MRAYMRAKTVDGVIDDGIAERVGLSGNDIEDMYQLMAIANYEDRFVIPDGTSRNRRGRLPAARLLRLLVRRRLLGQDRLRPVRGQAPKAKTPMEVE